MPLVKLKQNLKMDNTKTFQKFQEIFLEKNKFLNLISKKDAKYLWEKHIKDSLAISLFFEKHKKNYKTLLDIGTGGGFPSLPIAIEYPKLQVTGIDSIRKKIVAIDEFANTLGLKNFTTICDRVENIKDKKFDIITSRAVAKLEQIIKYALPLLEKNGYLVVYKSILVQDEIKEAEKLLKKYRAKVVDIIEYQLKTDEDVFERNLVVIKNV